MPNTQPSEIAVRFCEFHNETLARARQMMIEDGAPESIVNRTQADRAESWKGRRLRPTKSIAFAEPKKAECAATKQLRKDIEAREAKRAAESLQRLNDHKDRQRKLATFLKPPAAPAASTEPETENTMSKTAKKTAAKKAAKTKAAPKTGAKRQAKANARTPVAAGERARFDWKAAEEKALAGTIPPKPDFSAPTHARFLPIFKEITEACKPNTGMSDADDRAFRIKTLKAIKISPVSSTPKAMDRYRALCIKALTGKA